MFLRKRKDFPKQMGKHSATKIVLAYQIKLNKKRTIDLDVLRQEDVDHAVLLPWDNHYHYQKMKSGKTMYNKPIEICGNTNYMGR